jgi:hypothetical protein
VPAHPCARGQPQDQAPKEEQGKSLRDVECRIMIIESPLQLIFRDLFYRLRAFAESHDVFLN